MASYDTFINRIQTGDDVKSYFRTLNKEIKWIIKNKINITSSFNCVRNNGSKCSIVLKGKR